MGRKKKGSSRIEWSVSERVRAEAAVTAQDLKALGRMFVRHVLPKLGELPLPSVARPVFFPNSVLAICAARDRDGRLQLRLLFRDEAAGGGVMYRAYLSPLMTPRDAEDWEVREMVETFLAAMFPDPAVVPASPDGLVCSHPDLPWRMCLYRSGGLLHVHCYHPGEPGFDVSLDGYPGVDPNGRTVTGFHKRVVHREPARDGMNRVRPLGDWYHLGLRPSAN